MEQIKIIYHDPELEHIKPMKNGDWIDLRAAKDYTIHKGEFCMIDLGISMQLPDGYEAHVVPRSSTYKKFKILLANSFGIIDNSYCGTNDIWKFPAIATEDTNIYKNDRICQFRIVRKMPDVEFIEVDNLDENKDRGGFGSTGTN